MVNAQSRKGHLAFDEARGKLTAAGVELIDCHAVEDPGDMDATVIAAIERAPMVIVGGGDGSLSSTVDHFLGKDTIFAILPLGTANSFARTLGVPLDLDGAIDVIANGSHHGGVELVESAALDSGEIVVQAVTGRSVVGLAWSWFATLFKLTGREQTVTEFHGREMRVETRPHLKISIDGEVVARTPVTVTVARGAIEVAAPREG